MKLKMDHDGGVIRKHQYGKSHNICISPVLKKLLTIQLFMTAAEFTDIGTTNFPGAPNPGANTPVIPNMTAVQISVISIVYIETLREYRLYHNINHALKKQIIDALDDQWPRRGGHHSKHTYPQLTESFACKQGSIVSP
jgi:hypothetical protein